MKEKTSITYLHPEKVAIAQKNNYYYLISCGLFFLCIGLFSATPAENLRGLYLIITSPSNLLTDYVELGGFGSTFINAGILTLTATLLARKEKATLNGPMFAAILIVTGCSFFGKNIYNSISIIFGVFLYAKWIGKPFSQYVLIGLFGSALSPVVSYITFGLELSLPLGLFLGNLAGILMGIILSPLASQALNFHQGFSLYNIGFASGLIAMMITGIFRMFSYTIENTSILSEDFHGSFLIILSVFFSMTFVFGFLLNNFRFSGINTIFQTSGKMITDFITIAGLGPTLMNMGMMGFLLLGYVLVVGGQLNGPIVGAIVAVVGFSAFGNHWRNSFPVLVGIYLASTFGTYRLANDTGIIVAAIFGTGLAPISGYYGSLYGVLAGFLHISLVHNVGYLHGGLNLYNSGFSTGFVAGIMVPIIDNLDSRRKEKKHSGNRNRKKYTK